MKFITQFDDKKFSIDTEKLDKESLFEFGTYRDTQTMVNEFLVAGKNLQALREHQFDDIDDDGDFRIPSTREKGSDITDVMNEYEALNASINDSVNTAKSKSEAKKDVAEKTESEKKTVEPSD